MALRTNTRASGGGRGPLGLRTQSAMDGTVATSATAASSAGDGSTGSTQLIRRIIQSYDVLRDPAVLRMRLTMFALLFLLIVGGVAVLNVMGPLQDAIERHTRTVFDAGERTALVRAGFIQLINILVVSLNLTGDPEGNAIQAVLYRNNLLVLERELSIVTQRLTEDANFIEVEQLQADVTPTVLVVDELERLRTLPPSHASHYIMAIMRDILSQPASSLEDPSVAAYGLSDALGFEGLGQLSTGFNVTTTLKQNSASEYLDGFRTWTILGFAVLFLATFIIIAMVLLWSIRELAARRKRVLLLFLLVPSKAVRALRNRATRKLLAYNASLRTGDAAEGVDFSATGGMGALSTLVQEGDEQGGASGTSDSETAALLPGGGRAISMASVNSDSPTPGGGFDGDVAGAFGGSKRGVSPFAMGNTPGAGAMAGGTHIPMAAMGAAARFKSVVNLQRMSEEQLSDFAASTAARAAVRRGNGAVPTLAELEANHSGKLYEESGRFVIGSLLSMTGPLLLVAGWLLTMFVDQSFMINSIQVATQRVYMTQQLGAYASSIVVAQTWLIGDPLEISGSAGVLARDNLYRPEVYNAERELSWRIDALLHGTDEPLFDGSVALPALEKGTAAYELFVENGCAQQDPVFSAPDCLLVEEGVMQEGLSAALTRMVDLSVQLRTRFPYGDARNTSAVFDDNELLGLAARNLFLNMPYIRGAIRVMTQQFVQDATDTMNSTRNRQQVLTISIVSALVLYVLLRYLVQINRLGETVVAATTLLIAFPDAVVASIADVQLAVKEIASQSAVVLSQGDAGVHLDGVGGGDTPFSPKGDASPTPGGTPITRQGSSAAPPLPTMGMARQASSGSST